MSLIINNDSLSNYIKSSYELSDIQTIIAFLESKRTFNFPTLDNDLFSASAVSTDTSYTGYSNVWVRDNIYLAHTHYVIDRPEIAIKNVKSLMVYFKKFRWRFEGIIEGRVDPNNVMERPHVRFDGQDRSEIDQPWEQAQNDALGYFLWFCCKLARTKAIALQPEDLETLALFPFYFQAIEYWQDEDSGHWEEERKIAASSIGVVVAGLKSLKLLLSDTDLAKCKYKDNSVTVEFLDELILAGQAALSNILPAECVRPNSTRKYDAALVFLIYPLQVVGEAMSEQILSNTISKLQGDYGIRRYLKDSFWCRDYKDLPEEIRTSISSEREQWLKEHDRELREGEEAQWCIFDPIISAIFGLKFQKTHQPEHLERQTFYLNRSLGQLTAKNCELGEFKCPELYYLQSDRYVANDATPLLWTQANLRIALKVMEDSLLKMKQTV